MKKLYLYFRYKIIGFYPVGGGGGGDSSDPPPPPPPPPTAEEIARAQVDAAISQRPRAAQAEFDILSNPDFGLQATTQLFEDTRRNVFPQESSVRDSLGQVILNNLLSPTGISPQQQQSIDARRGLATTNLQTSIRNRQNLGGGLFGGRGQEFEAREIGNLQNIFAEEDIGREERSRLNAQSAAFQLIQILFPDVDLTQLQFADPVPSANTSLTSALTARGQDVTARGQDIQFQNSQLARQSALQTSLFGGLGTAAGGGLQGAFTRPSTTVINNP